MDKVRFGIIGIGNQGLNYTNIFAKNEVPSGVLTAVCDIIPERMQLAEEKVPGIAKFTDAHEMITSGKIDAVLIETPHYDHPPLSIFALKNKVHALSDKPIGVYTNQANEVLDVADEMAKQGIVFGIMYNERTHPIYRKMHEMVKSGMIGEIKRTNWVVTNWFRTQVYYNSGGWRATWAGEGGGVLINQCPHNLDLWQWICGMPSKVTGFCKEGKWHDIEVEDDVTAYVEYPNGATGVLVTTTGDYPGTNRFEITGDLGKLVSDEKKLMFYKSGEPTSDLLWKSKEAFKKAGVETIEVETDGQFIRHAGVIEAFAQKIMGKGELIATGREGINGLTISNAIHLSSWLGKTIELPLDGDLFYSELQKRVKNSKVKTNVVESVVTDMNSSFQNI